MESILCSHVFLLFPPAVRFGRIPKREKQRMLAEMHSAMSHITGGHFGRRSPVPLQPQQIRPSSPPPHVTPTSCPSPVSIPEAYPHYPQQLTPPRSPSPDQTEEVIGQVTQAHRQIFVYAHEKLKRTASWEQQQHENVTPLCWPSGNGDNRGRSVHLVRDDSHPRIQVTFVSPYSRLAYVVLDNAYDVFVMFFFPGMSNECSPPRWSSTFCTRGLGGVLP